jgi:hypothetical protein
MKSLIAIMEEIGVPYAYHHFAEGESPDPPFICFLSPGSNNFIADGTVYFKKDRINLELYTGRKDPVLESSVEAVLDRNGICYQKSEVWIESERLYEVLYTFEMEGINHAEEKEQG